MVNEMGNTSSSGDQEAEKAAANIQQNGEAVGNEENNIIPEGESDASDLPNNPSAAKEAGFDDKTGSTHSLTNGEAHTFPRDEQKIDQPMESILEGKDELHDQPSTNIEDVAAHDEVLKSCLQESRNGFTGTVKEHFISSETPENEDNTHMDDQRVEIADEMFEAVLEPQDKSVVNICDLKSSEQAAGEMQIDNAALSPEKNTSSDYSAKAGDINVQPHIHALPIEVPTQNGLLGIGMEGVNKSSLDNVHDDTSFKAPENITRLPEKTSNGIELRKSPSFDFGIRSLESDQTPLLCPEKTPTRSLSLGSNANFSNSAITTEYPRSSLDYEAVAVEEKTIRMERSDSDISKDPLLGLFKKQTNGQTQQNHVAVMKGLELNTSQENETSLTSPEGSRKVRKPRPSFFTTCICCAAVTH